MLGAEGYVFELERHGYIKAGPFAPEMVLDFPDAVRELHRELLRAGAGGMVALTYYAHREKLRDVGREGDLGAGLHHVRAMAEALGARFRPGPDRTLPCLPRYPRTPRHPHLLRG